MWKVSEALRRVWEVRHASERGGNTAGRGRGPERKTQVPSRWRWTTGLNAGLLLLLVAAGCGIPTTALPDRAERMTRGYTYYLDGAGGGKVLHNWVGGVREGLLDAGYDGAGEVFPWETGLGLVVDQVVSERYKRKKAEELAPRIAAYEAEHPGAPVTLMGLSAGTAVAAFALEAIPEDVRVANVVMLSGSLSSTYDLTTALRRVDGKMYVFTSEKDGVLGFFLPFAGTADRAKGTNETIGLHGVVMPSNPSEETRRQYGKIIEVPWTPQFEAYGHYGRHEDSVSARFIEAVVAPLVVTTTRRFGATEAEIAGGIPNPDYTRWNGFAVGSYVVFEGQQEADGIQEPIRVKVTLISQDAYRLTIERVFEALGDDKGQPLLNRHFYVAATIRPEAHPATHPQAILRELPAKAYDVDGQQFVGRGQEIRANGTFPEWGSDLVANVYSSPLIPGGLLDLDLRTHKNGKPVTITGRVVRMHVEHQP